MPMVKEGWKSFHLLWNVPCTFKNSIMGMPRAEAESANMLQPLPVLAIWSWNLCIKLSSSSRTLRAACWNAMFTSKHTNFEMTWSYGLKQNALTLGYWTKETRLMAINQWSFKLLIFHHHSKILLKKYATLWLPQDISHQDLLRYIIIFILIRRLLD